MLESVAEQAEESAESQELYLRFPYAKPDELRRAALACMALYAGLGLLFALVVGRFGWEGAAFGLFNAAVGIAFVVGWWRHWSDRPDEQVYVDGLTLEVVRNGMFGQSDRTFNMLEIHDLQFNANGIRYGTVWPLPRNHRIPWWTVSEPIVFTYHGRAYSFGGAPMAREDGQRVVEQIAVYDVALRRRYGMDLEPNITTVDHDRFVAATVDEWDTDVSPGALA